MPTYEYECEKCGLVFEEFQSITAEPLTKCRKEGCEGPIKRLISPGAGFIFKGSGFYATDYRSDSYTKGKSSSGSSTPSSTESSSGSSTPPSTDSTKKN